LLSVEGLSVQVGDRLLLRDVSFSLRPGEVLTLLGESGAGKSLLAQAVMGNLPASLQAGGFVTLEGIRSRASDTGARRPRWGRALALLPQEPVQALNPLVRLAPQLAEVHRLVRGMSTGLADTSALRSLDTAGLAEAAQKYPWQLSGGMAQRAAATIACAGGASVLLADEPTKGLDAKWREHMVASLQAVQHGGGCVIVITHDLRVARALGGRLMVLRAGEVVEQGDVQAVLAAPCHDFTRQLVMADPTNWPPRKAQAPGTKVLTACGLAKGFGSQVLFNGLDLDIHKGERLVVQGPSGTGKSTLGSVLLGLLPADQGQVVRAPGLASTGLQKLYQDPVASFAPRISLAQSLRDVARRHGCAWNDVLHRLDRLGVPHDLLVRKPSEVSGGELQRVALARVLMARPALLFADEPTSRLDPVSQQESLVVLLDAVDDCGAALVLVTHDDDIARALGTKFLRFDGKSKLHSDSNQSESECAVD
jgi:peptide/nickel transport system ATP-binding protein